MGKPSNGRTGEPRRARVVRCWRRSRFETLEDRRPLAGLEQLGVVLADRVAEIRDNFVVYRDADSALNHGVASGLFAGPDGTARAQTLRDSTIIATDCVFSSTTATQCATDPATLDEQRGTVLRVAFPALNAGEWVGLNIQEPQVAVGGSWHDLRGATRIEFDAYVSAVNGLPIGGLRTVEFGALQHVAARTLVVGAWTHVALSLAVDLGLNDADLNSSNPAHLSQPQVLFTVQTSVARSPLPLDILLDNIQYAPTPTSRSSVVGAPASNDVMGVVASAGEPYPADQVLANASFTYEQSLIVMAALHAAPDATRLAAAKQIADSFVYQLHHDQAAGPELYGLPAATDGVSQFHGLHDGVHGGDIALLNHQPGGQSAGQLRLAEFTVPGSACGAGATTSYCVFADGATGGNNAFAVLALVAAHRVFRESDPGAAAQYLDAAREIGNWIEYSLRDDSSIGDATHPGFGGYFLGYADRSASLAGARRLQTGKSLENVADIFAGFSQLAMIERERGDVAAAATWDERARHAGDFVLRMYDPSRNTFYAGTMPKSLAAAPGLTPAADCSAPGNDAYCQGDEVLNRFEFLDSISFPILALAGDVRYREAIDWRLPADRMLTRFHRTVLARSDLWTPTSFEGFNIVAAPTAGPGGREPGADGISWEFTGQVVATLRYVDQIYNESRYATPILKYQAELRRAYVGAPFANAARGVVAATMDESAGRLPPRDQCVSTPFQCIAARIGTAATAWSYFAVAADQGADKNSRAAANFFAPQWRIPEKTGESFTVEDWENKVTSNDLGFNNFGGNVGGVNQPSPDAGLPPAEQETRLIANTTVAPDPSTPGDFTAQIDFDFGRMVDGQGAPAGEFGGLFLALMGLTDTMTALGSSLPARHAFPGYFLDFDDLFGGFGTKPRRSVDAIEFRAWSESSSAPVTLKIELKDETGHDVFARVPLTTNSASAPTRLTRAAFNDSVSGAGSTSAFDWRQVSAISFLIEYRMYSTAGPEVIGVNPLSGQVRLDDVRLVDVDGRYPDLSRIANSDGRLSPYYEREFLDEVRESALRYFVDFASTSTEAGASTATGARGLIQDRSTFADLLTSGGAGFQISAYIAAAERGHFADSPSSNRAAAAARVRAVLELLADPAAQGPEAIGRIGHRGFLYHFLGVDGARKRNFDFPATAENEALNTVELSTIDTALAVAGALAARQYFDGSTVDEGRIRQLADQLYAAVDWKFMLADVPDVAAPGRSRKQFYLGWKPNEARDDDSGRYGRFQIPDADGLGRFSSRADGGIERPATLDYYTDEGLLVGILAMSAPDPARRVDRAVWDDLIRQGDGFTKTYPGALFTYQFFSNWFDTYSLGIDNYADDAQRRDFFVNTTDAINATRAYVGLNEQRRATWSGPGGERRWGLNAAEGPFDAYAAEGAPSAAKGRDVLTKVMQLEADSPETNCGVASSGVSCRPDASNGLTRRVSSAAPYSTTVTTFAAGLLSMHWRYSNSTASSTAETLHVTLDGRPPVSLGLPGTGPSVNDWNTFAVTDTLYFDEVAPGPHTLVVAISGGDELAELDYLSVGFHRSLESGTATSYGVGSSVTHVPGPSVDGLYEVSRLGLNHPRFGPADAFNLDISAAKPGLRSTSGGGLLRDSGDWAHYTGFAIDQGPLALAMDAYLDGGAGLGLAMSDPRLVETLATLFPNYLNGHRNPLQPLDVDADGTVAPIDALQIVNRLNSPQYDALHARLPILPHRSAPARYLDTNGDRFLAPSDVLAIVNHLNAQAAGAAEGEQNQAAGNANFMDAPSAVSASTATASDPTKSVPASAVPASTVNASFDAGLLQWLDEEPSRRRRDRRN